MKLTKEQILFTETYLKNSGVRYADIRLEMTDHVAAALEEKEGDFYENFRMYMLENKRSLLASNRSFRKLATTKAFNIIKGNFLKLHFWGVLIFLFSATNLLKNYVGEELIVDYMHMSTLVLSTLIYVYFLYYKLFTKNINSVIDKLITVVYCGTVLFRIDKLAEGNTYFSLLYFSFAISFMLMLIISLWELNNRYKLLYNG